MKPDLTSKPPVCAAEIAKNMKALHYDRARSEVKTCLRLSFSPWLQLTYGQCLAGLQQYKKAEDAFMAALECAPTPLFEAHVCLRLCRLYTQTGHLKKASQFREQAKADLERVQGKTNPAALRPLLAFYDLASAWLLYEQGKTSDALQTIQSFIAGAKYISSLQNALCEAWTLQADLLSVLYSYPEAIAAYQKALECTDSTPENWRPLRKALILNNLADVYEGAEDFENANRIYLDAMDQLDRLKDEHIVDLSACHLEILLSFANCLIQQEEMDDSIQQLAHHPLLNKKDRKTERTSDHASSHTAVSLRDTLVDALLDQAIEISERVEWPARLYWKSRIHYIEGLSALYQAESRPENPFPAFLQAWIDQKEFLLHSPVSSREYLGRVAYYAAYSFDPKTVEAWRDRSPFANVTQKELYLCALDEFEKCAFKDPAFFGFTMASIQNELGTIALKDGQKEDAKTEYEKAEQGFENAWKQDRDDLLALSSLCTAELNLLGALDESDLDHAGKDVLKRLLDHLDALDSLSDHAPLIEEALGHLIENDRYFPRYTRPVERFCRRLQHKTGEHDQ